MEILRPAIERGDVKVVSDQFAKEWKTEEAFRITEDALTKTNNNSAKQPTTSGRAGMAGWKLPTFDGCAAR